MDAPTQPVLPARETPSVAVRSRIDEIVIVLFAFMGVGGAVFLPLRFHIPPITTSFLLATGLAALTYRFLGGIQGTSLGVGSLKLTGVLAALVGIAMIVNHALSSQTATTTTPVPPIFQVWQVTGQILDENGNPFTLHSYDDISINPQNPPSIAPDGSFTINVASSPDANGAPKLPELDLSHNNYRPANISLENFDLQNTGGAAATGPTELPVGAPYGQVTVNHTGNIIQLNQIKLQPDARYNPTQPLISVNAKSSPPENVP
jgi:hypothetical protein